MAQQILSTDLPQQLAGMTLQHTPGLEGRESWSTSGLRGVDPGDVVKIGDSGRLLIVASVDVFGSRGDEWAQGTAIDAATGVEVPFRQPGGTQIPVRDDVFYEGAQCAEGLRRYELELACGHTKRTEFPPIDRTHPCAACSDVTYSGRVIVAYTDALLGRRTELAERAA
jgi:hypothetical protein